MRCSRPIEPYVVQDRGLEHSVPGVGHVVPDNLSDLLPAALAFVLAS